MKQIRVIQVNLDLRLLSVIILVATLLVVTSLTMRANSASENLQQGNPNDPNEATPAAPVDQAAELPVSSSLSPNGDSETVGEMASVVSPAGVTSLSAGGSSGGVFFLTNFNRNANTALTACGPGFHMASMWELADISNLTYNTSHPSAYLKSDAGSGPPALWYGWVRTGYDSSTTNTAGVGNCANWTSTLGTAYGTIARLTNNWDVTAGALSYWEADPWTCSGIAPVWCVGD
jgi:hypothetical protein